MRGGLVARLYCLSSANILLLGPSEGLCLALLFSLWSCYHTPACLPGDVACSTMCAAGVPALSSFLGGRKTNTSLPPNKTTLPPPRQAQKTILPLTKKKQLSQCCHRSWPYYYCQIQHVLKCSICYEKIQLHSHSKGRCTNKGCTKRRNYKKYLERRITDNVTLCTVRIGKAEYFVQMWGKKSITCSNVTHTNGNRHFG